MSHPAELEDSADPASALALITAPPRIDMDDLPGHIARGRRMRSQAIAAMAREIWDWLLRRPRRPVAEDALREEMLSALTAIRSSAEVLRDHPCITPGERSRFLGIVLDEEKRMERLLTHRFGRSDAI
ncbi:MAG: hypothetical protein AAFR17_03210 [Pseudomonadota bacterium]